MTDRNVVATINRLRATIAASQGVDWAAVIEEDVEHYTSRLIDDTESAPEVTEAERAPDAEAVAYIRAYRAMLAHPEGSEEYGRHYVAAQAALGVAAERRAEAMRRERERAERCLATDPQGYTPEEAREAAEVLTRTVARIPTAVKG